jgi:hypothetical protein
MCEEKKKGEKIYTMDSNGSALSMSKDLFASNKIDPPILKDLTAS